MKIHSEEMIPNLETMMQNHPNPKEGDMLVSDNGVMETCAPYVGQICAEFCTGDWLIQPYSRNSEYLSSIKEAFDYLDYISEEKALWDKGEVY